MFDSPIWPTTSPVFVKVSNTVLPSTTEAVAFVNSIMAGTYKQHKKKVHFNTVIMLLSNPYKAWTIFNPPLPEQPVPPN